ncbi:FAD-binding oxidoreductase [Candidatus Peregrinibacteria bacterium]|nr:MAG: FAD-binding oxidoreductase [Candidatus Peregrinibacteria bacterium]
MTAYFLLTQTSQKITLLEAGKVAHGATGHNAGQMVSGFEKSFKSLVERYGLPLATRAQQDILQAWDLLEGIKEKVKLETPMYTFTGYSGFTKLEDLLEHLENRYWLKEGALPVESILIASNFQYLKTIPEKFQNLFAIAPHGRILELLQTKNEEYMAVSMSKAGVTNSAKLTEELAMKLLALYPSRFKIFEKSKVDKISLSKDSAKVYSSEGHQIQTDRVVLCTNGFEKLIIENETGPNIDDSFHTLVRGLVGYMLGFYEPAGERPMSVNYHGSETSTLKTETEIPPYFYLTRRPYKEDKSLLCLGGPEYLIPDRHHYDRDSHIFPEEAHTTMDSFLKKNYAKAGRSIGYTYFWHGVMGYTPSGLRCVGPDSLNPVLMYNLGCNGTGILSSIMGAKRIADHINHKKLESSVFDPIHSGKE